MKHFTFALAGLLALCLAIPAAFSADLSAVGPAKAEPPPSADGIYRLSFYGAPGVGRSQMPVTVWLERQGGGFTQGFAVVETVSPDAQRWTSAG